MEDVLRLKERAAQVLEFAPVQIQRHNGYAPRRGADFNFQESLAPPEMFAPTVAARMKQSQPLPGDRIKRVGAIAFDKVTNQARKSQIIFFTKPLAKVGKSSRLSLRGNHSDRGINWRAGSTL